MVVTLIKIDGGYDVNTKGDWDGFLVLVMVVTMMMLVTIIKIDGGDYYDDDGDYDSDDNRNYDDYGGDDY